MFDIIKIIKINVKIDYIYGSVATFDGKIRNIYKTYTKLIYVIASKESDTENEVLKIVRDIKNDSDHKIINITFTHFHFLDGFNYKFSYFLGMEDTCIFYPYDIRRFISKFLNYKGSLKNLKVDIFIKAWENENIKNYKNPENMINPTENTINIYNYIKAVYDSNWRELDADFLVFYNTLNNFYRLFKEKKSFIIGNHNTDFWGSVLEKNKTEYHKQIMRNIKKLL